MSALNPTAVNLEAPSYSIGQAVFLRTDSVDYEEVVVPFQTLDEMVRICSTVRADEILDKVLVYSMAEGEPCALTLGFVAATKGVRPPQSNVRV